MIDPEPQTSRDVSCMRLEKLVILTLYIYYPDCKSLQMICAQMEERD